MTCQCGIPLLALMAALAIGAQAPAAAQARVTFTTSQRVALEGKRSGEDVFTAGGIAKECPKVSFSGTLRGNSTSLRLIPQYGVPILSGCVAKALGGLHAKFVASGCSYLLHAKARMAAGKRWRADVDILCPDGALLEWNVYENQREFELGNTLCTTAMLPQTGLGTAELSNVAGSSPDKIAIHWNLTGIKYKAYGSTLFCGPLYVAQSNASYTGEATIAAKDASGHPVDLTVSG